MKKAKGYKITNIKNNMCYYGIVYKDLDVHRRFKQHMIGKGGVILYEEGVIKFGAGSFVVEEIIEGDLSEIRDWEYHQNIHNLWPTGYNGNAGKVIIRTELTEAKRKKSYSKYLANRTSQDLAKSNKKKAETRAKRTVEEIKATSKKLSAASKKFWNSLDETSKISFLKKRGEAKSKAYHQQTEEYKQVIRYKIKTSMCKKRYISPSGIHTSTVDGGKAEGISPALFNHRCKSVYYPAYRILTTGGTEAINTTI
jgi:hypothetical protein